MISGTFKSIIISVALMLFILLCQYVMNVPIRSGNCLVTLLGLYMAGIIWVLTTSQVSRKQFKYVFQRGFQSFVFITFLMVIFFIVFYRFNPQILDQFIKENNQTIRQAGTKTPGEIATNEQLIRSYFVPMTISFYTLLFLFFGVVTTAITSLFLTRSK